MESSYKLHVNPIDKDIKGKLYSVFYIIAYYLNLFYYYKESLIMLSWMGYTCLDTLFPNPANKNNLISIELKVYEKHLNS